MDRARAASRPDGQDGAAGVVYRLRHQWGKPSFGRNVREPARRGDQHRSQCSAYAAGRPRPRGRPASGLARIRPLAGVDKLMFGDESITREILGQVPAWLVALFYVAAAASCTFAAVGFW